MENNPMKVRFLLTELVLSYSFTCEFRISHPNFAVFRFQTITQDEFAFDKV